MLENAAMQGNNDRKRTPSSITRLWYSIITACVGSLVFVVAILSEPEKPHRNGMLWIAYLFLLLALIWSFRAWWHERKDRIK
jgi:hypothetical protein